MNTDPTIQPYTPPVVQLARPADPTLIEQCTVLINNDFKAEITHAIKARGRWEKLNKTLEVCSHVLQGTTTILAFISAAIKIPAISLVAGCAGVCATVSMAYSQNCKTTYKELTRKIQKMSGSIGATNILPDDTSEMNIADDPAPTTRKAHLNHPILTAYNNQLHHLPPTSSSEDLLSSPTPTPTPNQNNPARPPVL
jgi:hypothetical protein